MNKKIRWITETAVLLALLIALQWAGSTLGGMIPAPLAKQLITGTLVNCVLTVAVLYAGYGAGLTLSLVSPVVAFFLGIAPQIITVVPIMLGNACFVALLALIAGREQRLVWRKSLALIAAAAVKFGILYVLVVWVVCSLCADSLLGKKLWDYALLAPKMLESGALPLMFSWPQLITALCGGMLGLLITPMLRKALRK